MYGDTRLPARRKPYNPCAQCGASLFMPLWSEHVNERCIRSIWSCDQCGYEYETTVYLREGGNRAAA